MEVATDGIQVRDLIRGRERRGVFGQRRPTRAALVVEDDDMMLGQRREVIRDTLEIDPGTAVDRDDRITTLSLDAVEKADRVRGRDPSRLRSRHRGEDAHKE